MFQFVVGSPSIAQGWNRSDEGSKEETTDLVDQWIQKGLKDPAVVESQAKIESLAQQIDSAGEHEWPRGTPDTFRLTNQSLELFEKKSNESTHYRLSDYHTSLPDVRIGDFDAQVSIENDIAAGRLSFVLKKGERVIARHSIEGVHAKSFAVDRELLQWVEPSGKIFAVDMNFARTGLFSGPVPVFEVARLPESLRGELNQVSAEFMTRGTRPPDQILPEAVLPSDPAVAALSQAEKRWTAGDFALFSSKSGERILVSVFDRSVTLSQVQAQSAVLALLAYAINIGSNPADVAQHLKDPHVLKATVRAEAELTERSKEALYAFDIARLKRLTSAGDWAKERSLSSRDQFLFNEWQSSFDSILSRATGAQAIEKNEAPPSEEDLSREWQKWSDESGAEIAAQKAGFRKIFNARSLRKVAFLTALTAAATGGTVALADGAGPVWATHAVNSLMSMCWPDVLKDAAYRTTLIKSLLGLSSIMMVQVTVGVLLSKAKQWSFQRALATFGIRAYAALQTPFQVVAARMFGQPRVISAMQAGISPFKRVIPQSTIGKKFELKKSVFPALSSLFRKNRESEAQLKESMLDETVLQKKRARSLAWLLANMVASEKFGVDLGVQLELQQGNYSDEEVKALLSNRYFLRYWNLLSTEIYRAIDHGADGVDFANLSKKEIADYYAIAKKTAERISKQTPLQRRIMRIKATWSDVWHEKRFKAIGNFGMEGYGFLRSVDPSEFVSKESWNSFWVDYIGTLTLNGLAGARADFKSPDDLAASPNHFMWTNPAQLSDMIELNLQHTMTFPSSIAQKYGDENPFVGDSRYAPIEYFEVRSAAKAEKFMSGFLGTLKSIVNLRDAGYGELFKRGLIRKMKSLQAGFIFYALCRILVANQDLASVVPSFIFGAIWSIWASEWVWEPLNRGNYLHESKIDSLNDRFEKAKVSIAQGLRLNQAGQWQAGYGELAGLYSEFAGKMPRSMRKAIDTSEEALGFGWDELVRSKDFVQRFMGAVIRLKAALENSEPEEIEATQARLRELYLSEGEATPDQADARALLAWSLDHPPVVSRANRAVGVLSLLIGSITSTVLATQMIVDTHHAAAWGEKIASAVFSSAIIYGAIFAGQKVIDNLSKTAEYIRLREGVPPEAFELAKGSRPKFESLNEYVDWLKSNPESGAVLQNARTEDVVQVLKDARVSIQEINRERPAAEEIRLCALLLGRDVAVQPLRISEKIKIWIQGVARPPIR